MRIPLLLLIAAALLGCGGDKTVNVGKAGEKGVIRTDIDQSKGIAHGASDQIKQGEKDVYGG